MNTPLRENISKKPAKTSRKVKVLSGQYNNDANATIDNAPQAIQAAAYIRVSTDEQAESGYSLQLQRERIAAQITAKMATA